MKRVRKQKKSCCECQPSKFISGMVKFRTVLAAITDLTVIVGALTVIALAFKYI